ncbi:MAG: hypothetical protein R3F60_25000 [bacterium]
MRGLLCLLVLLAACDRADHLERPLGAGEARVLDGHLAWLQVGQRRVVLLDPRDGAPRYIALEARPQATQVAPDGRGWLLVDAAGATWLTLDGDARRIPLQGAYRRIAFAAEGDRVVLFGEQGTGPTLNNPNQIAVLDLAAGTATERTLRSYGSAPREVILAPPILDRRLAWLLADRYLALIDLDRPEAREIVVHLVLPTDAREVSAEQLAFADVEGERVTFIRARGSDDVFSLTFPDAPDAPDALPRPYLNQLPGAPGAADLWAGEVADGPRIFTTGAAGLAITHPATGRRTMVPLPAGAGGRLLPFRGPRPDDAAAEAHFALLWGPGRSLAVFIDLDRVEQRGQQAVTPLALPFPVSDLLPLPGRRGAVARIGDGGIALLDFDARTATPLTASAPLRDLIVEPGGARVHALLDDGYREAAVVSLDAATGATQDVRLPRGGRLLFVPGVDRVVVDHGETWGRISGLDGTEVTDFRGFFLEGGR